MADTKQMRIEYNEPEDQFEIYIRESRKEDWGLYQAYPCQAPASDPGGVTSFIHFNAMLAIATLAAKGYEVSHYT